VACEAASADIAMPARATIGVRAEIPHRRDLHRILQKDRILEKVTMPDAVPRADTKRRLLPMRSKTLRVILAPFFLLYCAPFNATRKPLGVAKN
jgi:hypothetical protein